MTNIEKNQSLFAGIKGAVWDLDNTLYRTNETIDHAFNIAIARAALDAGADLTLHDATEIAMRSYLEYGYGGAIFVHEYGVDGTQLHMEFHNHLDETAIEKTRETRELFEKTGLSHVLVTHSSKSWAKKVLFHMDLLDFFPDGSILGMEDYNFVRKSESSDPFEMARDIIGLPSEEIVMVEDLMKNLRHPYEMGMKTVFLHHGREPDEIADFVDYSCNNAIDVLSRIKEAANPSD